MRLTTRLAVIGIGIVPIVVLVGQGLAADGTPPKISVSVSPVWISPNGDGASESTAIAVHSNELSHVRVYLQNASGANLMRLAIGVAAPKVPLSFSWDGRFADHKAAPDGRYTIAAFAADASGNSSQGRSHVVVDTAPPAISWIANKPEPLRVDPAIYLGMRLDDASQRLSLSYEVLARDGHRVDLAVGLPVTRGVRWQGWTGRNHSGGLFPNGVYRIRVAVADQAGNKAWSLDAFRIHRQGATRVLRRVRGARGMVALTFDDGLYPRAWRRILDTLAARKVHATFFVNGVNVRRFPSLARRTLREGHTIGSHTYFHANLTRLRTPSIRAQLFRDERIWWRFRADPAPYFRPPFEAYDARVLKAVGALGYQRTIMWDIDTKDYRRPGAGVIMRYVVSRARAGSIVLMHVQDQTAVALGPMITRLMRRGLRPVSIDEMLAAA